MSPHPVHSRIAEVLRKARSDLRGGHVVALSAVAVMAFGLVGLRAIELPGPRPVNEDDRLKIEVVYPVEPDIVPGSVMDVGELVDGFQGVPPPLPPLTDVLWSYDDGWEDRDNGYASPQPPDRRMAGTWTWRSWREPERPSPARALQRWFGFDAPRRDFQAERAARQARLEAMEQRARERYAAERRRYDRAELDRYAREGWRPVPLQTPRWRESRPLPSPLAGGERIASGPASEAPRGGADEAARPPIPDGASAGEIPSPVPAPPDLPPSSEPETEARDAVLTIPGSIVGFSE